MTIKEAYIQIDKYLDSDKHGPIVVDVADGKSMIYLIRKYNVGGSNLFISACDFCKGDNMPLNHKLKNAVSTSQCNLFLTDYSTYLKLLGEGELQLQIKSLLTDTIIDGKLIIFTSSCHKYLMQFDRRLIDSRRIIFVGENIDSVKRIFFIDSKLPIKFDRLDVSYADGLAKLPALVEKDLNDNNELLLKTSFEKNDFRHSLFDIKDIKSSHDMIVSFCKDLNKIDRNLGSEKQWNELFTLLQDNGFEWLRLVNDMIGSEKTLANTMMLFHSFSDFKQWLYFIALKYFGANENNYLTHVVYKSNNLEQFITELYDSILRLDYDESNFIDQYKERKFLLSHFPDNSNALISYSKKVTSKGLNAVYYLTDLTKLERELIIKYIGDFALENERPKVEELLQILYPALSSYLNFYNYGEKYNEYFDLYKYNKLTNRISERFISLAEEQVLKRDFLTEPTRAYVVDKLNKEDTFLYFMDAMGIEFLSYIQALCFEKKLEFKAQIARCNLPSITVLNKEFVEEFTKCGCVYSDVKDLDEIKHKGQMDYDYEKVKQPIHLAEEMSILDKVMTKIDNQLQQGSLDKVVLIADHGASRMAVISESENKWEMAEKGQHSGRCCLTSEVDDKPECSIEENDFWCLLNYDRFKGSRKANVEVHGGASLEEVLVPIIEITKHSQQIDCWVESEYKIITSSFKKKAMIKFYLSKIYEDVSILVDGKQYYKAKKETNKDYIYEVEMPDLKKTGIYSFDVLVNNSIIKKDLRFELKKEGANERKFF